MSKYEKFKQLVKAAGYKSILKFCQNTISPVSGKPRNHAGIQKHLTTAKPYDIRVIHGYAKDLKVSEAEIMELFEVGEKYDFVEHLLELGFNVFKNEETKSFSATLATLSVTIKIDADICKFHTNIKCVEDFGHDGELLLFTIKFTPKSADFIEQALERFLKGKI